MYDASSGTIKGNYFLIKRDFIDAVRCIDHLRPVAKLLDEYMKDDVYNRISSDPRTAFCAIMNTTVSKNVPNDNKSDYKKAVKSINTNMFKKNPFPSFMKSANWI